MSANDTARVRRAFPSGPHFDKIVAVYTTRHAGRVEPSGANPGGERNRNTAAAAHAAHAALADEADTLDLDSFTAAKQVHGADVRRVTESERGRGARAHADAIPSTDALITDLPGVPIGVFTADCVPVFLYDPARPAVGIAHAGWRGTAKSISQKTIEKMRSEFGSEPAKMWAAIGPSIGQCCYEVGADVFDEFQGTFEYADILFRKTGGEKWHLDLWLANRRQLEGCGVDPRRIIESRICSACNADQFHSARKHGPLAGRTLSVIAIKSLVRNWCLTPRSD